MVGNCWKHEDGLDHRVVGHRIGGLIALHPPAHGLLYPVDLRIGPVDNQGRRKTAADRGGELAWVYQVSIRARSGWWPALKTHYAHYIIFSCAKHYFISF